MSLSQGLLPEFDQEMAKTRSVLSRIPMDKFDWKPHEKSFGMGDLANHVARMAGWGMSTMTTDSLDYAPVDGPAPEPPIARTTEELLALFDESVAGFREAIEGATDEHFMAPWTLQAGGEDLFTMPRGAVIRTLILNHIIHHRAQLTVYLRLNDLPVPGLYGPSADEAPA
jgi:uncharacterized damage-inducible protein DinB